MKVDGEIQVGKGNICKACGLPELIDGESGLCYDCNRGQI